jgi:GT2 family glycosyltransferase
VDQLTQVAKNVIKEYGFGYFLQIAINELKKYKLDVFKLNNEKQQGWGADEIYEINYARWLDSRRIKYEKIASELEEFESENNFTIIIGIGKHNEDLLMSTLKSLKSQKIKKLKIFLKNEENGYTIENIINKKEFKNFELEIFDNSILSNAENGYTIVMSCGDEFNANIFYIIEKTINENKNAEIIYFDEDVKSGYGRIEPYFKPNWSPELFLSKDYISSSYIIKNKIFTKDIFQKLESVKMWKLELLLKLTERTNQIFHINTIVLSMNKINIHDNDNDKKRELIQKTIDRRNIDAEVFNSTYSDIFRIKYKLKKYPKVSILIPTKNNHELLKRCLDSIKKLDYKNYEIIIIDNDSTDEETKNYLKTLDFEIVKFIGNFNFSKMNNKAAKISTGEYLLFLNDDVMALDKEWLSEMMSYCQLKEIGIVGSKLLLRDNRLQHGGIALLKNGAGFHPMMGENSENVLHNGYVNTIKNCVAVTGACLLIKKNIFEEINGFDEEFDLYYNDVDLCLKVQELGYRVVYTPYAKLLHDGSTTIKKQSNNAPFFAVENHLNMIKKWGSRKEMDPYYNKNLDFNFKLRTYDE